eukprot:4846172-Amphidinium_carterae.1
MLTLLHGHRCTKVGAHGKRNHRLQGQQCIQVEAMADTEPHGPSAKVNLRTTCPFALPVTGCQEQLAFDTCQAQVVSIMRSTQWLLRRSYV